MLWISGFLYWNRTEAELDRLVGFFPLQNLKHYSPNVAWMRRMLKPAHQASSFSRSSGSGQAEGKESHKWEHLTTRTVREKNATVKKTEVVWQTKRASPLLDVSYKSQRTLTAHRWMSDSLSLLQLKCISMLQTAVTLKLHGQRQKCQAAEAGTGCKRVEKEDAP